ncbi:MAG: CaiB/BaiF CoA-transferase family protein [Rhodothermales bacterium]
MDPVSQVPPGPDGFPFANLLVVELASVLAGPSVGQYFAELGARVIKVENPHTGGDVTRSWLQSGEQSDGRSAYFHACNWGKESVVLDLATEEGRAVRDRLVARADIVLVNALPGARARTGTDIEAWRQAWPRLIVGLISGYADDPERPGFDALIQAESGFYHLNGSASGPQKMPVALMDLLAAHGLKEELLVALLNRATHGRGAVVEVSLMDAALASLANRATGFLHTGVDTGPEGSDHPMIAPYGTVFTCTDGTPVVVAVGSDGQFHALCDLLEVPLSRDPRFATNAARVRNRTILKERLQDSIGKRSTDAFLADCRAARVPAGRVADLETALAHAHDALFLHDTAGRRKGLRSRLGIRRDSSGPMPHLTEPPVLGAHTEAIRTEFSGEGSTYLGTD